MAVAHLYTYTLYRDRHSSNVNCLCIIVKRLRKLLKATWKKEENKIETVKYFNK